MTEKNFEELLGENGYDIDLFDGVVEYPGFRKALLGFTDDFRLVYDYDRMVEIIMEDGDVTIEEAREFIDFNYTEFGVSGVKMPIIINSLYI